ncbi:MAG TPA: hypothetical protein VNT26_20945, partial [Candidatus Sulfotelmatobacter sp.]|nr:hypothetical protein [Candidatus Sulfotelmatobacter sp.]
MADIKFTCPQCQQPITCDELWCGHQIQCPGCQGNLTVPPKPEEAGAVPAAADSPLVPKPPAATKLSIGQAHKKPEAAAQAPQRSVPIRDLTPPPPKKKNPAGKIAVIGVVVVAVGAGGYFGYDWYTARQKAKAEAEAAAQAAQAKAAA